MAYSNEDKVSLYQSVSSKLADTAAELQQFVADADAEGDTENREKDVADAESTANQLSNLAGKYQVLAKRLTLNSNG